MNRIDRLSAILIMLQTKKLITANEIAERFNVSLRTIYRDMHALDEAGIPLGAEAGRGYYLVEGFHLPPVMFTPEEAGAMLIAGKLTDCFADVSVKHFFNLATDKIKSVLPESHRNFIAELDNHVHVYPPAYSDDKIFSNNFITTIEKALSQKKCLKIKYAASYSNEITERIVEPLGLCFYGFQWHLIAFCKLRRDYRDFRADRIMQLYLLTDTCNNSDKLSISEFFKLRASKENLFEVEVKFHKDRISSIAGSRYYFGFYEEQTAGKFISMKFAVNDYNYIAGWLITLGDMVEEVSPANLKTILIKLAKTIATKYLD